MFDAKKNGIPRLTGLAAQAAGPFLSFLLLSLIANLIMLVGSIFMLQVYDRVLPSRSLPTLWALLLIVLLLYGLYALIDAVRSRMSSRFASWVDALISPRALEAGIKGKLMSQGLLQADPVRDLDTVRVFLGGAGPVALFDVPWMPIYLVAIFLLHPLLGWISVGSAAVMTALLIINEVMSRAPAKKASQIAARRQGQSDETKSGAESLVAMGMLPAIQRRWAGVGLEFDDLQRRSSDRAGLYSALSKSFRFLMQSAVLAAGAYLVIRNEVSGGLMIAASIISSRAIAPVEQIIGQWKSFVAARQAWTRLDGMVAATVPTPPETSLPIPTQKLTVSGLVTGPTRQAITAQGISFELVAGEAVGILGPSGSGKSSVARALVGAWPALSGEIRLDGSELAHYDAAVLGAHVGYLAQQVDLFSGTIAENITRFEAARDDHKLFEAAKAAGVHDLIAGLQNGYDTQIGERGTVLSAGQRQRIGLARALYGNPFLLVLDEPNSNLDAEGDDALNAAITAAKARGAIVVIVAHRPSAIVAADKILFLRGGRQLALGPKDEVLARIAQPAVPTTLKPRPVAVPHG